MASVYHAILNTFEYGHGPEERVQSTTHIAEQSKFHYETVREALHEMEEEGILDRAGTDTSYVWMIHSPMYRSPKSDEVRDKADKLES